MKAPGKNIQCIYHAIVSAIDYNKADRKIELKHPLGDVYIIGPHGYVKDGNVWLRFMAKNLPKFQPGVNYERVNDNMRQAVVQAMGKDIDDETILQAVNKYSALKTHKLRQLFRQKQRAGEETTLLRIAIAVHQ